MFSRRERKALQDAVHLARHAKFIDDERCTELCALVERETDENNTDEKTDEKPAKRAVLSWGPWGTYR